MQDGRRGACEAMILVLFIAGVLVGQVDSTDEAAAVTEVAGAPAQDEVRARLEAVTREWSREGPGCVARVILKGETIFDRSFGLASLEFKAPLSASTPMYVGSLAKQFLAALGHLLHAKGTLDLDADIRKLIPELRDQGEVITARHLIAHASGIRDYLQVLHHAGVSRWDYIAPDILPTITRQSRLDFSPGTETSYSNSGYYLLELLLERASGEAIDRLAERLLFKPLGMTGSRFLMTGREVVPGRARGYRERGGVLELYEPRPGTSGLLTTAVDLARWAANLRRPTVGGPALVKAMTTPAKLRDGTVTKEASGLRIGEWFGRRIVEHNGSNRGFTAQLSWFPGDDLVIIVLSNARGVRATTRARALAGAALGRKASPRPPHPRLDEKAQKLVSRFTGAYATEDGGVLELEIDGPYGIATLYGDHPGESRVGSNVLAPTARKGRFVLARLAVQATLTLKEHEGRKQAILHLAGRPERVFDEVPAPTKADVAALVGSYYGSDLPATWRLVANAGGLELEIIRPGGRRVPRGALRAVTRDFLVFANDPVTSLRVVRGQKGRLVALELSEPRVRNLRLDPMD